MDPDPSDSCTFNIGIRSFVTELFGIWIGGDNFEEDERDRACDQRTDIHT